MWPDMLSCQAERFYHRPGFATFAIIGDDPPAGAWHFLTKRAA